MQRSQDGCSLVNCSNQAIALTNRIKELQLIP